jgi:anti-sigma factor RsiW
MSQDAARPSEAQLHAYVDGFLAADEAAAVERFLLASPDDAQRLEAYRRQNEALLALRTLPDARPFTAPARRPLVSWRTVSWRTVLTRAVAAVLLLAVGAGAGWLLHERLPRAEPAWLTLVRQAERAHVTFAPEVAHPVEVRAEQGQHLQTWLSRRLGKPIAMPLLAARGYALVGGRLLPGSPGPAAQFMYENKAGSRLTLYLATTAGAPANASIGYTQIGDLWICYWVGEQIEFALTGAVDREHLREIAEDVYAQLEQAAGDSW